MEENTRGPVETEDPQEMEEPTIGREEAVREVGAAIGPLYNMVIDGGVCADFVGDNPNDALISGNSFYMLCIGHYLRLRDLYHQYGHQDEESGLLNWAMGVLWSAALLSLRIQNGNADLPEGMRTHEDVLVPLGTHHALDVLVSDAWCLVSGAKHLNWRHFEPLFPPTDEEPES